jgi:hypothetical protein
MPSKGTKERIGCSLAMSSASTEASSCKYTSPSRTKASFEPVDRDAYLCTYVPDLDVPSESVGAENIHQYYYDRSDANVPYAEKPISEN